MDFAIAAPFGLLIGSFLNVVAYRLPRGESLVKPRSRCTSCGEEVRSYDNVPVLSWLVLRGRCRFCGTRISARYPAVELVTALGVTRPRIDDALIARYVSAMDRSTAS